MPGRGRSTPLRALDKRRLPGALPCRSYMAALLKPYSGEGLDPAWLEPAPKKCRLGVELLSCSS